MHPSRHKSRFALSLTALSLVTGQLLGSAGLVLLSGQPLLAQETPRRSDRGGGTYLTPPEGLGDPPTGRRSGGASRSPQCSTDVMALVPPTGNDQSSQPGESTPAQPTVWAVTASDRPVFWFYLPYEGKQVRRIQFALNQVRPDNWNQDGEPVMPKIDLALPGKPGIVALQLPKNVNLSQTDRPYRWYLNVYCASGSTSIGPTFFLTNTIRHLPLNPELAKQLQAAKTPGEKASLYARNGYWHDALTLLAQQRTSPNARVEPDWSQLLQSVGLSSLVDKPVLK